MRTTLTLDEDVAAAIKRLRKTRRQSLTSIVNEMLREGLKYTATMPRRPTGQPTHRRPRFRTGSANLGQCLLANVDDVSAVLEMTKSKWL